jgi:endonuclease III
MPRSSVCGLRLSPLLTPWVVSKLNIRRRIPRCACRHCLFYVQGLISTQNRRFATLISLMLSSQTKDEVTDAAVSRLRAAIGGSISVDALIQAEDSTIAEAIAKVGFWRRKTEYVEIHKAVGVNHG